MLAELNIWIALLVFTLSLPLAVMSGAALLGLRDTESKAPSLLRLLTCAAILLALMIIFGTRYHIALLAAFACVITLHLLAYWGLRRWVNIKRKC